MLRHALPLLALLLAAPAPGAPPSTAGSRIRALPKGITREEREALRFLYAGMPLSDLADLDAPFFLEAVRASLEARRSVPWGRSLTEELFRHFVLPPRVNNENLDAFRARHFRELLARVKGMGMAQAALEINHWCHEKVVYQGTDSRTSGPLSTIRSAFGRCGEESTFAVSALRAACIPARQVYTPRWAHCDDNHAWVEVWVDGAWHYLGACEPEPELDMGWFREPARRTMLVHTRAFGPYRGSEPVVQSGARFAELNLTAHYAPVKAVPVTVVDRDGKPLEGATVEYRLYNYGEFYPLAARSTDARGRTELATGLGDLLLWARKGDAFGFRKITVEAAGQVTIALDGDPAKEQVLELDQVPPVERPALPASTASREENARRLKEEDAIRGRYTATFMSREKAIALALELKLDGDRVWKLVSRSAGNWAEIEGFLRSATARTRPWALPLLESVSDKDLRDTPASVLRDHLEHAVAHAGLPEFRDCVLCPRVDNELLSPWRSLLPARFPASVAAKGRRDPALLAAWTKAHIRLDDEANHYRVPLRPAGVLRLRRADSHSRDIFFVALCRALGVPARLDPALRRPQYLRGGKWMDAALTPAPRRGQEPLGTLVPVSEEKGLKYGTHFTLARFREGSYRTLELDDDKPLGELARGLELPAGHYLAVTGNRVQGGTVLARLAFFELRPGETRTVPILLRKAEAKLASLGRLDACSTLELQGRAQGLLELAKGRGAILVWAGPGQEPTRHVMGDVRALKEAFEKWGGPMAFLLPEGTDAARLGADFQQLPARAALGFDPGGTLLKQLAERTGRSLGANLPVIAVVDASGHVVHLTEGYQIGAGEQTLKVASRIQEEK